VNSLVSLNLRDSAGRDRAAVFAARASDGEVSQHKRWRERPRQQPAHRTPARSGRVAHAIVCP